MAEKSYAKVMEEVKASRATFAPVAPASSGVPIVPPADTSSTDVSPVPSKGTKTPISIPKGAIWGGVLAVVAAAVMIVTGAWDWVSERVPFIAKNKASISEVAPEPSEEVSTHEKITPIIPTEEGNSLLENAYVFDDLTPFDAKAPQLSPFGLYNHRYSGKDLYAVTGYYLWGNKDENGDPYLTPEQAERAANPVTGVVDGKSVRWIYDETKPFVGEMDAEERALFDEVDKFLRNDIGLKEGMNLDARLDQIVEEGTLGVAGVGSLALAGAGAGTANIPKIRGTIKRRRGRNFGSAGKGPKNLLP